MGQNKVRDIMTTDLVTLSPNNTVRELRNCISHNRIVLEADYKSEIIALRDLLPERYVRGFEKDIRGCTKDLSLNEKWTVIFVND